MMGGSNAEITSTGLNILSDNPLLEEMIKRQSAESLISAAFESVSGIRLPIFIKNPNEGNTFMIDGIDPLDELSLKLK